MDVVKGQLAARADKEGRGKVRPCFCNRTNAGPHAIQLAACPLVWTCALLTRPRRPTVPCRTWAHRYSLWPRQQMQMLAPGASLPWALPPTRTRLPRNRAVQDGHTPLLAAASHGKLEAVKALLAAKVEREAKDQVGKELTRILSGQRRACVPV